MSEDVKVIKKRYALDVTSLDEDVAVVLPEELRKHVADDLLDFVNVLKTLRDQLSKASRAVESAAEDAGEQGVSLADEGAEEAEPPADGQESAAANTSAEIGQNMGLVELTLIFDQVSNKVDALKDRFAGVDSTISGSKAEVGKVTVAPAPWKLLSEDVRTHLSAAGDLEVSLAEKSEQLKAEASAAQALREDLEAAQEGLRPLQRALIDKEEKLTEETTRADASQKEHDVIKDAYDKLTADLKAAEEEIIVLKKKGGIGRRSGGVTSSPAMGRGTPKKAGDSEGGELTQEQLEEQMAEIKTMVGTVTRLREAKKRAERERARQRLSWLKDPLPEPTPKLASDASAGDAASSPLAATKCCVELSNVLQSTRAAQARMKVIDLTPKAEGGLAPLQLLASAQAELTQLASQRESAAANGRACVDDATRGVATRALTSFLREGTAADVASATAVARLHMPGATAGAGSVARTAVVSALQLSKLHASALRI
eukprot:COSAG02_NODE_1585_length_11820_cov_3.247078_2_plen_487_part_00